MPKCGPLQACFDSASGGSQQFEKVHVTALPSSKESIVGRICAPFFARIVKTSVFVHARRERCGYGSRKQSSELSSKSDFDNSLNCDLEVRHIGRCERFG